ncbi:hypothetical protein FB45DRAFT_997983 [Roridomyces roridus]|uniref:Uncharacterized protein n=1 Tax=Roridomyces roridus TaxID=1738132 RepID=A0AAD7CLB5_9AGAR|nr:hypothetical protein FB45DRAFT_997983 [Roridomyces roridus]
MSSNSTDTDDILFLWGQSICRQTISHGVGWLFYGIYLAAFFTWTLRPHHARQFTYNRTLQCAMLILFISCTLQFLTDFIFSIAQIQGYLMSTTFSLPDRKNSWQDTHLAFYVLQRWPATINFVISDMIVLWRACTLRHSNLPLRVVLWGLGVADAAVWGISAGLTSRDAAARSANRGTDQTTNTAAVVISLVINIVGTVAIGVLAWKHHRTMNQASMVRWTGDVPRILLVLVETGIIWAFIQAVYVVLETTNVVPGTPLDMATGALTKAALYLAAILPTVTLIIIRSKRSVEDVLQAGGWDPTSSNCPRCSGSRSHLSGGRGMGTSDAVRLTMRSGQPKDLTFDLEPQQQKFSFGGNAREVLTPPAPIAIRMEQETEVVVDHDSKI